MLTHLISLSSKDCSLLPSNKIVQKFITPFCFELSYFSAANVLQRVIPLETPLGLVIGFINHSQVVTTFTYYTVTHLHSLQSVHSNIPILFGASGIHLETADR
jgi:hypothetical protein